MTTSTFTEGQRVYDPQRQEYGSYVRPTGFQGKSMVKFPHNVFSLVITAQLVAADKVEESS